MDMKKDAFYSVYNFAPDLELQTKDCNYLDYLFFNTPIQYVILLCVYIVVLGVTLIFKAYSAMMKEHQLLESLLAPVSATSRTGRNGINDKNIENLSVPSTTCQEIDGGDEGVSGSKGKGVLKSESLSNLQEKKGHGIDTLKANANSVLPTTSAASHKIDVDDSNSDAAATNESGVHSKPSSSIPQESNEVGVAMENDNHSQMSTLARQGTDKDDKKAIAATRKKLIINKIKSSLAYKASKGYQKKHKFHASSGLSSLSSKYLSASDSSLSLSDLESSFVLSDSDLSLLDSDFSLADLSLASSDFSLASSDLALLFESESDLSVLETGSDLSESESSSGSSALKSKSSSGSSTQQSKSGSSTQHSKSGSSTQQSKSGSSTQHSKSGSSTQQSKSGSSTQQSKSDSATQQSKSGSSTQQLKSGSSTQQSKSDSATQQSKSGSATQQSKSGSSTQQLKSGSSTQQLKSGSSTQQSKSGSSTQQSKSDSATQQSKSGSSTQQSKSGASAQQSKSTSSFHSLSSLVSSWSEEGSILSVVVKPDAHWLSRRINLSKTGFAGVSVDDFIRLRTPSAVTWKCKFNMEHEHVFIDLREDAKARAKENTGQLETLDCNAHEETYYDDLFLNRKHYDVLVVIGTSEFPIHKDVLLKKCPTLFFEITKGIGVYPFALETFQELLRFIYCGRVQNSHLHVPELLWAAHFHYKYKALKKYCEQELAKLIKVENAYAMYNLVKETKSSIEIELSLRVQLVK